MPAPCSPVETRVPDAVRVWQRSRQRSLVEARCSRTRGREHVALAAQSLQISRCWSRASRASTVVPLPGPLCGPDLSAAGAGSRGLVLAYLGALSNKLCIVWSQKRDREYTVG